MKFLVVSVVVGSMFLSACDSSDSPDVPAPDWAFQADERFSGGGTSVPNRSLDAYSRNSNNMITSRKGDFNVGNDFFEDPWVAAPASTTSRDGLGPLFNVSACQSCHINDGRGHAPINNTDSANSLLVRISHPATTGIELAAIASGMQANIGDTNYGGQIQDRGLQGVLPEAKVVVNYAVHTVTFDDGFTVDLRNPTFELQLTEHTPNSCMPSPAPGDACPNVKIYGDLDPNTIMSMRVAPPMIGLGLLAAISEEDILSREDALDENDDGISGRANRVWDEASATANRLGRFGWKAGQPSLAQQNVGAFNGDMGLTSTLFPNQPCTTVQTDCANALHGVGLGEPVEVSDPIADVVEFYTRNLAVPYRSNPDGAEVLAGKKIFFESNCVACHTPSYQTPELSADFREQSDQTIFPYTDMLLHDMGEDLADSTLNGAPAPDAQVEFLATSREWRTPPLWGIGVAQTVNSDATFLHDGRARTLLEAVLWHGGEAEDAKENILALGQSDRDALVAFLQSL